ncbi:MAG: endonuclease V [Candidatus Hodarchaeota archaeon]
MFFIKTDRCKVHSIEYYYVCPECVQPYLINTPFSTLEEVREFQKENAKKVSLIDKNTEYNLIGLIKIRFLEGLAYSGLLIYNISDNEIVNISFKSFKPIFTKYLSSILFLNQTDVYMDLICDSKIVPDCYIVNSSGQIHPFLYGCACDFGLKINIPVIGYTKKLLFGELKETKKNIKFSEIYYQDRILGYAIPKIGSKRYFYISVGNNISLKSAMDVFLKLNLKMMRILKQKLNSFIRS